MVIQKRDGARPRCALGDRPDCLRNVKAQSAVQRIRAVDAEDNPKETGIVELLNAAKQFNERESSPRQLSDRLHAKTDA